MPVTSRGMERTGLFRIDQAVEAVFKPEDLDAGVAGGFDDGTDDGIQAGGVASPGEDTNFFEFGHGNGTRAHGDGTHASDLSSIAARLIVCARISKHVISVARKCQFSEHGAQSEGRAHLGRARRGMLDSLVGSAQRCVCETVRWSRDHQGAASSAGRALRSQCRGREFDPRAVHQVHFSNSVISDAVEGSLRRRFCVVPRLCPRLGDRARRSCASLSGVCTARACAIGDDAVIIFDPDPISACLPMLETVVNGKKHHAVSRQSASIFSNVSCGFVSSTNMSARNFWSASRLLLTRAVFAAKSNPRRIRPGS